MKIENGVMNYFKRDWKAEIKEWLGIAASAFLFDAILILLFVLSNG